VTRWDRYVGVPVDEDDPIRGRRRYRYDVRDFKIVDGGYHQCSGQVVAVLGSTYNRNSSTWYVTVLVRRDEEFPELSPGEEVWRDDQPPGA